MGLARDRAKVFRVIHLGSISTSEVLLSRVVAFPVIHLRTQDAPEALLTGVARAGERQNSVEGPSELCQRGAALLPVNHLRTQDASQVLLTGVKRAGEGIMVSPAHLMCPIGTSGRGQARR